MKKFEPQGNKTIPDFGWLTDGKKGNQPINCFHCEKEAFVEVRYKDKKIVDYKPELTCKHCGRLSYAFNPVGELYKGS